MSERSATSTVKKQEKKIVENLSKRTHFSSQEIERLLRLYRLTVVRELLSSFLYFLISAKNVLTENLRNEFPRTLVKELRWTGWTGSFSGSSSMAVST